MFTYASLSCLITEFVGTGTGPEVCYIRDSTKPGLWTLDHGLWTGLWTQ